MEQRAPGAAGSPLFRPGRLGGLQLRNRLIRAAAFEGLCPEGRPAPGLLEYHRAVAAGGVGLTTVAYVSVSDDGRTYAHQMSLQRDDLVPELRALTDAVHREGAAAAVQLGHGGYFADKKLAGGKPLGASRVFCTYGLSWPRAMDADDRERVTADFVAAARRAREAGFDAIELHVGHGYLLSQYLCPHTNRRTDEFGGSLENRLRFPLAVVRRVREAVGPELALVTKVNLRDGFRGGLELDEAIEVCRALAGAGIDGLVLSGGFVSKMPWYILRGTRPIREMVRGEPSWGRKTGLLLFGRMMVKPFEFTEGYFLEDSRKVREAVDIPLVVVGGFRQRRMMEEVLAEGFEFIQLGRPLIHDPEFVNKLARGELEASACEPCNECVAVMDQGGIWCPRNPEQVARRPVWVGDADA